MSAPATRVFLLPAALFLTRHSNGQRGQLRQVLVQAWNWYNLEQATSETAEHPFVKLAAALSAASLHDTCLMLLEFPVEWQPLVAWIEQLIEESLGKGDKGIVVFKETATRSQATAFQRTGTLHVVISKQERAVTGNEYVLSQPYLDAPDKPAQLAALAASFLGWQLTMALYGYLHDITFAGQPAVEDYKARARAIRDLPDPLQVVQDWPAVVKQGGLTLYASQEPAITEGSPASVFGVALRQNSASYLDLTINGELSAQQEESLINHLYRISQLVGGVPIKPRRAPADYHSTEQGEMDGPAGLLSLRFLTCEHAQPLIGIYSDAFLRAQAVSTWQAMLGQGRTCFLLVADGDAETGGRLLEEFFADVTQFLL